MQDLSTLRRSRHWFLLFKCELLRHFSLAFKQKKQDEGVNFHTCDTKSGPQHRYFCLSAGRGNIIFNYLKQESIKCPLHETFKNLIPNINFKFTEFINISFIFVFFSHGFLVFLCSLGHRIIGTLWIDVDESFPFRFFPLRLIGAHDTAAKLKELRESSMREIWGQRWNKFMQVTGRWDAVEIVCSLSSNTELFTPLRYCPTTTPTNKQRISETVLTCHPSSHQYQACRVWKKRIKAEWNA